MSKHVKKVVTIIHSTHTAGPNSRVFTDRMATDQNAGFFKAIQGVSKNSLQLENSR